MALIGFRSPLTYHPWPWSEYTEAQKAELFVRVNPIHEKTDKYSSSKEEIDEVIEAGADLLMLPYFKTAEEVQTFVKYVKVFDE